MRLARAAAVVALAASAASAAPPETLDLTAFFAGRTHGENRMKLAIGRPKSLIIDSIGKKAANGAFILTDTVREEGKPVRERRWVMRPAGRGRFTGSLTDAIGPVDVQVSGTQATIRYSMKGGLRIDQRLDLQPGGRTLSNQATVRKLGLKVGRVDGIVRKLD